MKLYRELFRNGAFLLGFWLSGAVFLILNLIPHRNDAMANNPFRFSNFSSKFGFPFVNFQTHLGVTFNYEFIITGLVADTLIGTVFSFAVGLTFKYISEEFAHHRRLKQIRAETKSVR